MFFTIFLHLEVLLYFFSVHPQRNSVGSFMGLRVQWVRQLKYFPIRCDVQPLSNAVVISILLNTINGNNMNFQYVWERLC